MLESLGLFTATFMEIYFRFENNNEEGEAEFKIFCTTFSCLFCDVKLVSIRYRVASFEDVTPVT